MSRHFKMIHSAFQSSFLALVSLFKRVCASKREIRMKTHYYGSRLLLLKMKLKTNAFCYFCFDKLRRILWVPCVISALKMLSSKSFWIHYIEKVWSSFKKTLWKGSSQEKCVWLICDHLYKCANNSRTNAPSKHLNTWTFPNVFIYTSQNHQLSVLG